MHERFTHNARKAMHLADQESQRLNNEYIGTEHLLLGIAKLDDGVAVKLLRNLGLEPQTIITEVANYALKGSCGIDSDDNPFVSETDEHFSLDQGWSQARLEDDEVVAE